MRGSAAACGPDTMGTEARSVKTFMVIGVSLVMLVGVSLFLWLSPAQELQLPSTTLSNDVLAHSLPLT